MHCSFYFNHWFPVIKKYEKRIQNLLEENMIQKIANFAYYYFAKRVNYVQKLSTTWILLSISWNVVVSSKLKFFFIVNTMNV